MTIELRPAEEGDLDAMWRIERDVFDHDAWSREMLREELVGPHRHYLVLTERETVSETAEVAGTATDRVVGYGGLLAVGEQGDIQTVAVAPAWRGQGLGRRLMLALADEAAKRGVRDVFLEVRADNPVARGLYASLGFAVVGVRPKYYQPDAIDAIVMRAGIEPAREDRS